MTVNGMDLIGMSFSIILRMLKKDQIVKQLTINKNALSKLAKLEIINLLLVKINLIQVSMLYNSRSINSKNRLLNALCKENQIEGLYQNLTNPFKFVRHAKDLKIYLCEYK